MTSIGFSARGADLVVLGAVVANCSGDRLLRRQAIFAQDKEPHAPRRARAARTGSPAAASRCHGCTVGAVAAITLAIMKPTLPSTQNNRGYDTSATEYPELLGCF